MTGMHIIIDIYDIEDNSLLKYSHTIIPILNKIIDKYQLNIVGKAIHQFEPFGVTAVYILAESHLSIHTFVEEGKVAIDLYTCTQFSNIGDINEFFKSLFDNDCNLTFKIIER